MQYHEDDNLLDIIEDYLRGKLPAQEAADFERQIAADSALAETVDMMRVEQQAIELMFREELRAKLGDMEKVAPISELAAVQPQNRRMKWLLAALLAVLAAGGIWFIIRKVPQPAPVSPAEQPQPKSDAPPVAKATEPAPKTEAAPQGSPPENRYASLMTKFYDRESNNRELEASVRGGDIRGQSPQTSNALAWMKSGKPEKAIPELLETTPSDGAIEYEAARKLLAHAYFQNNRFADAAIVFRELAQKDEGRDEAQWYLLLCLVADYPSQKAKADALFDAILQQQFPDQPTNNHPFLLQAIELKKAVANIRR